MNVLLATPWLFPRGGGLERYAHTLGVHLAGRGHRVVEVGHADAPVDEELEGVRRVGVTPRVQLSNTPLSALQGVVARLLREERIDVLDVHTPVPGTAEAAAWAAWRARVPYVVTYHAGELGAPAGVLRLAAWLHRQGAQRFLLAGAAAHVAVSPYVAQHVFSGRVSLLVPPGVDAERFRPVAAPVAGRILFVGPVDRAYAWKGLATLFDAFERLAARHPEAHLRVVGAGDLVAHYRARALAAGLEARVELVGRLDEADLVRAYSEAHVVALPSLTPAESFGMVLAEANACARPVVGSRVGGIPSFVREGVNGLLVEPGDAVSLADAIGALLRDPARARRMGEAGRAIVLREHRWEDLAARTEAALASVVARPLLPAPEG